MNLKELFEAGASFRTFILNQATENRGKIMKYYIPMSLKEEHKQVMDEISYPVNILGIADGSCPDCHIGLAVLEKLISTNHNINLRLITKTDAQGKLDQFAVNGSFALPTLIFMDEGFKEKAAIAGFAQSSATIEKIAELILDSIKKTA